jgi:hypothetical protein
MNSKNHTGAAGELFAATKFLEMGFEVFRNTACSGPIDLMLWHPETGAVAVDVKSIRNPYVRVDGTFCFGSKCLLREDGVWQVVYVHGESCLRLPEGFPTPL